IDDVARAFVRRLTGGYRSASAPPLCKWASTSRSEFQQQKVSLAFQVVIVAWPRWGRRSYTGRSEMRSKRQTAWETPANCATLAKEADDPQEREFFARMRDAWITLANRCEYIEFPDVTEK